MIKGISEVRRLPRIGVIRLGKKAMNSSGVEYPTATDYFVCPSQVQKIYGEKPKKLDIRFPADDPEVIFPQYYKEYGKTRGLVRKCNGEMVQVKDSETGEWQEKKCDCTEAQHKPKGTLNFILPKVTIAGVYQITTSSYNSIVAMNSQIDYIKAIYRKIAGLPLTLELEEQETHPTVNGKAMKKIVHILKLSFDHADIVKYFENRQRLLQEVGSTALIESPVKVEETTPDEEEEQEEDVTMSADAIFGKKDN